MTMIKRVVAVTAVVFMLSGCAGMTAREQRVLSGAGIGAAGGAVIGAVTAGNPGAGAAVGAAVGGAVGAVGGLVVDEIESRR